MRTQNRCLAVVLIVGFACTPPPEKPISSGSSPATLRHTSLGDVVGGDGRGGSQAWLGIPFAQPPVGDLRWRAPSPAAPWTTTREATQFASACVQYASALGGLEDAKPGEAAGSEDCLYLNVWSPAFTPDKVPAAGARLPVMFWIHGGGNAIGTAKFYDGGKLAVSQNVIVVTTQYRMGPFGWFRNAALRDGEPDADARSGNFGTLDQIQSLKWVRDNIAAFGGDPGNVTIFGESAGGEDVYSLLVSPRAKGLFHRAIAESGGMARASNEDAENFVDDAQSGDKQSSNEVILKLMQRDGLAADRASAKAKLASMSKADVAKFLRSKNAKDLLTAYDVRRGGGMIEMPLVIKDGAVLPAGEWTDVLADPNGWNKVPVIAGSNHDEDKLFLAFDPTYVTRTMGVFPHFVNEPAFMATAEYVSRAWKANAVDSPAAAMRKSGATDVYVYRFDWHDEPTTLGIDLGKLIGAAHGLEIPFVFDRFNLGRAGKILYNEQNEVGREQLSSAMMGYWAQFARTGSPGRGRGDWPEWTPFMGAEKPDDMILDTSANGGVRMAQAFENREKIPAEVDADARLTTQMDRCRVFHELAGFVRGISMKDYPAAGKDGCAQFPFDDYPWDGSQHRK